MASDRSPAFLPFAAASCLAACNALVGIEDVVVDQAAGGGPATAATASSGSGATSASTTATSSVGEGAGPASTSSGSSDGGSGPGGGDTGGGDTGGAAPSSSTGEGGDGSGAGGAAATSSGSGGGFECPPPVGLIGHWVAADAVDNQPAGTEITAWPARVGPTLSLPAGNAAPLVAAVGIGGRPAVTFEQGTPHYLSGALDAALFEDRVTLVAVARHDVYVNGSVVAWWGEPSGNNTSFSLVQSEGQSYQFGVAPRLRVTTFDSATSPVILVGTYDRIETGNDLVRAAHLHQNGATVRPGGEIDEQGPIDLIISHFAIGGANPFGGFFDGEVAEVLVYDRALPTAERHALEACLGDTYGIAVDGAIHHCENGVFDPAVESATDCGGECSRCTLGKTCNVFGDCHSDTCEDQGPEVGGGRHCVAIPRGFTAPIADLPGTFSPVVAYVHDPSGAVRVIASDDGTNATEFELADDDSSWVDLGTDSGDLPPYRSEPGVAHDPTTNRAWIFGGVIAGPIRFGDTWEWDGSAWSELTTPSPQASNGATLGYLRSQNELFLLGGEIGGQLDGMWTMTVDATPTWLSTGTSAPRAFAPAAYDETIERLVVVGGVTADTATRFWTGASFVDSGVATFLDNLRHRATLVEDPKRRHAVMIGGTASGSGEPLPSIFEFAANRWFLSSTDGGPDASTAGVAVYDGERSRVVHIDELGNAIRYFTRGTPCDAPEDCATGFCADAVCCDSACTADFVGCNLHGEPGVCSAQ
jgi:hypothetical protein